jgi:predicted MFS family arabinose efflux permease
MPEKTDPQQPRTTSLPLQLGVITLTRTLIYTGLRMVYPFLPALARGMGVSLETAAVAVTLRSAMGILSPVFGSLGDTKGRKWSLRLGLVLLAAGSLLVGLLPSFPAFLAGSLLIGLGIVNFDPSIQAYVGDRVPYQRRALAMAVVEFGWSGAFLIGIPLVGRVIDRSTWSAPFLWVGGLLLFSLVLVELVLPESSLPTGTRPNLKAGLQEVLAHPPSMAAVAVSFLMITGSRNIMIVYGAWFEEAFQLTETALGDVSTAVGLAGIAGLVAVAALSDRLGKKTSYFLGLGINLLTVLALPYLGGSLALTVGMLFVYYLAFEFALVTALSLVSELRPGARATLMAFHAAAVSAGDTLGSFVGPRLFNGGIFYNAGLAAVLNAVGLLILFTLVRLPEESS